MGGIPGGCPAPHPHRGHQSPLPGGTPRLAGDSRVVAALWPREPGRRRVGERRRTLALDCCLRGKGPGTPPWLWGDPPNVQTVGRADPAGSWERSLRKDPPGVGGGGLWRGGCRAAPSGQARLLTGAEQPAWGFRRPQPQGGGEGHWAWRGCVWLESGGAPPATSQQPFLGPDAVPHSPAVPGPFQPPNPQGPPGTGSVHTRVLAMGTWGGRQGLWARAPHPESRH